MTRDEVTDVAKGDRLIVALGESWFWRSIGNPKATYYASQHMRLMSKMLLNLRNMQPEEDKDARALPLWDFLVPQKFDDVLNAAIMCGLPYMDGIEELQSPTNKRIIRIKYDLYCLLEMKWTLIHSESADPDMNEASRCDIFMWMMKNQRGKRVTKLARHVLLSRKFGKQTSLPSPEDIQVITNDNISSQGRD